MELNHAIKKMENYIEQIRGVTYKKDDTSDIQKEGYVPIIRANNIQNGNLQYSDLIYVKEERIKRHQFIKKGDIIIASSSGSKHLVGKAAQAAKDINFSFGAFCKLIRANKNIDSNYLGHYFNSNYYRETISSLSAGANINNIKNEHINDLEILVPPINIQKQIVEILDEAQRLIDNRKEQIKLLDDLIESVFYDMFGDPVRNDKGWEVKKLKEESICIVPARDKPKSFTGSIPWITINDLEQNGYTISSKEDLGLTENEVSEVNRKVVPIGCVLMSCVGNLGITSINGVELVINQQIHAFKCSGNLNNKYLKHYIPKRMDYIDRVANSTTVKYINKTKCENIPLLFPPIELQNQFAEKVEQIESQKQLLEDSLQLLEDNYNSLMQRAFKGQLF